MAEITLPDIPNITSRHWQGGDDYAHTADLVNLEMASLGVDQLITVDDIRVTYDTSTSMDLATGFRFVEIDGRPVAMVLTRWWDETDGPRVYRHMCKVHPEWRNQRIGMALQGYTSLGFEVDTQAATYEKAMEL